MKSLNILFLLLFFSLNLSPALAAQKGQENLSLIPLYKSAPELEDTPLVGIDFSSGSVVPVRSRESFFHVSDLKSRVTLLEDQFHNPLLKWEEKVWKFKDYPWAAAPGHKRRQCLAGFFSRNRKTISLVSFIGAIPVVFGGAAFMAGGVFGTLACVGDTCSLTPNIGVTFTGVSAALSGFSAFILSGCSLYNYDSNPSRVRKIFSCNHEACVQTPTFDNIPKDLQCAGKPEYLLRYPVMVRGASSKKLYSLEYIMELIREKGSLPGDDGLLMKWERIIPWWEIDNDNKKRIVLAYLKSYSFEQSRGQPNSTDA